MQPTVTSPVASYLKLTQPPEGTWGRDNAATLFADCPFRFTGHPFSLFPAETLHSVARVSRLSCPTLLGRTLIYSHSPLADGRQGGVGGFFLACEDLGRMFDNSFPACTFFFPTPFFFFFEIRSCTPVPLFTQGSVHSGSAN